MPNRGAAGWSVTLYAIALDMQGNVYVAGSIGSQTFDFGNGVTLKGQLGNNNILLAKYDASGTAQWARTSNAGTEGFQGATVDSAGNVYAVGLLLRGYTVDFGNQVSIRGAPGVMRWHMLLVKYDSTGTAQWARSVLQSVANSTLDSVTVDAAGNVYAAGMIREGTYDLGNGVTVAGPRPGRNLVLVSHDSSGTPRWAQTLSTTVSDTEFRSLTFDSAGHLYAVGTVGEGTAGFGSGVTVIGTGHRLYNAVIVKY